MTDVAAPNERDPEIHEAFLSLACAILCFRRLQSFLGRLRPGGAAIGLRLQHRVDEFLAWCRTVGPRRLRNSPDLVEFSADKRYLCDLSMPTVPTTFVESGDPLPELIGEVVIKPNISAGARDTGRFSRATHEAATALIERIRARGGVALFQPYLSSIDRRGETALVFFGGELSYVLRKRALLYPDEVAPMAREGLGFQLGVAQAMFEEDLVVPGEADPAERELAGASSPS